MAVLFFAEYLFSEPLDVQLDKLGQGVFVQQEEEVRGEPQDKHGVLAERAHSFEHILRGEDEREDKEKQRHCRIEHGKLYHPRQHPVFLLVKPEFENRVVAHKDYEQYRGLQVGRYQRAEQCHCNIGRYCPVAVDLDYHHDH